MEPISLILLVHLPVYTETRETIDWFREKAPDSPCKFSAGRPASVRVPRQFHTTLSVSTPDSQHTQLRLTCHPRKRKCQASRY